MKAQISTEYLVMVGFALLLTIPTAIIFFTQTSQNVDQVNFLQARQITRSIVDNSEKVFYLGKPSTTTIKVVMPRNIQYITIANRNIVFGMLDSTGGVTDVVEASDVNITGTLLPSTGTRHIRIENIGDSVNISYSS